jgi:hypothetical protein
VGKLLSCLISFASLLFVSPLCLAIAITNKNNATSWVVNAFVEATPISVPA